MKRINGARVSVRDIEKSRFMRQSETVGNSREKRVLVEQRAKVERVNGM
jgi:hypothetical protein